MNAAQRLVAWWQRCERMPAGKSVFARLIALTIPYTGSVRPRVLELHAGHARVEIRDRRAVRNHLGSVHAVALTNLGELASGLALVPWLQGRGIVTELSTEYVKKARGTITAVGTAVVPQLDGPIDHVTTAVLTDEQGDIVARVRSVWLLEPVATRAR